MVNYLARLGWSHGDEDIFNRKSFISWFDLAHVSKSAAQFNPEKLAWLNQQHMKLADDMRLAGLTELVLQDMEIKTQGGPAIDRVVGLLKERANTVVHLAEDARMFYEYETPTGKEIDALLTDKARPALKALNAELAATPWERKAIGAALSAVLKSSGLKMPELAMPVRLLVTGRKQTPSLDAVLELLGRETVRRRLAHFLEGHT